MTLGSIHNDVNALLRARGGIKVPELDVFAPLAYQEIIALCHDAHVLTLVTTNTNLSILRSLGGGYYMRFPAQPTQELDEIEIDEGLRAALSNKIAVQLARDLKDARFYNERAMEHINMHNFKIYNTEDLSS